MPSKQVAVTAERIRPGLYRLVGIVCGGDRVYGPCGGELHAERMGDNRRQNNGGGVDPEFRWETFCAKCKTCDPNGWSTLADCVREAAEYFK